MVWVGSGVLGSGFGLRVSGFGQGVGLGLQNLIDADSNLTPLSSQLEDNLATEITTQMPDNCLHDPIM